MYSPFCRCSSYKPFRRWQYAPPQQCQRRSLMLPLWPGTLMLLPVYPDHLTGQALDWCTEGAMAMMYVWSTILIELEFPRSGVALYATFRTILQTLYCSHFFIRIPPLFQENQCSDAQKQELAISQPQDRVLLLPVFATYRSHFFDKLSGKALSSCGHMHTRSHIQSHTSSHTDVCLSWLWQTCAYAGCGSSCELGCYRQSCTSVSLCLWSSRHLDVLKILVIISSKYAG